MELFFTDSCRTDTCGFVRQALEAWRSHNSSSEKVQELEEKIEEKLQSPPNVHSTQIEVLATDLAQYKVKNSFQQNMVVVFRCTCFVFCRCHVFNVSVSQ